MTHTNNDFIKVCNEVLNKQDLNQVERVHSFSFWIDLKDYLEQIKEPKPFKPISKIVHCDVCDNAIFSDMKYCDRCGAEQLKEQTNDTI